MRAFRERLALAIAPWLISPRPPCTYIVDPANTTVNQTAGSYKIEWKETR